MSNLRQQQVDRLERLKVIYEEYSHELDDWQRSFVDSILDRFETYGVR